MEELFDEFSRQLLAVNFPKCAQCASDEFIEDNLISIWVYSSNLGKDIEDRFSKLRKIFSFFEECFRGGISKLSGATVKIFILGDKLGTRI